MMAHDLALRKGKPFMPFQPAFRLPVSTAALFGAAMALSLPAAAGPNAFTRDPAATYDAQTGLRLPEGFRATVFARDLGTARHVVVRDNGDVFVNLMDGDAGESVVALRDTDGDGVADVNETFGDQRGTGIDIRGDWLYVSSDSAVVRYRLGEGLTPEGAPETIVSGFPDQRAHRAKSFTFDADGHIYVNQGVPSNACQQEIRTPGSQGRRPCPENVRSGVWRFDADTTGQDQMADGLHFATGLRHSVAIDFNPLAGHVYVVQHGRDQLNTLFPDLYDAGDNAELPAEEMHLLEAGHDAGWPYSYYDGRKDVRFVAPEYGGDGKQATDPGLYAEPIQTFPAHWAPNDLLFYTGDAFPEVFRGGAFVAFHGSWNRAPRRQGGYNVVFQPFDGAQPKGDWGVFADGFAQGQINSPGDADHRPTGLAQGPDGALYIADSREGYIWRVTYGGVAQ